MRWSFEPCTDGDLEAGGGDYSNRRTEVQALLAPRVRSCAYDRAELGWSNGTASESFAQGNADLHALLAAAGGAPPYVLVGHSIGALLVRRYLSLHSDTVIGMVLVEPTHESQQLFNLGANRWLRIREQDSLLGSHFRALFLLGRRTHATW
jgi:pimeloyl-ACP methyl ester carboxylesterase